jgi:hypothetical protein
MFTMRIRMAVPAELDRASSASGSSASRRSARRPDATGSVSPEGCSEPGRLEERGRSVGASSPRERELRPRRLAHRLDGDLGRTPPAGDARVKPASRRVFVRLLIRSR